MHQRTRRNVAVPIARDLIMRPDPATRFRGSGKPSTTHLRPGRTALVHTVYCVCTSLPPQAGICTRSRLQDAGCRMHDTNKLATNHSKCPLQVSKTILYPESRIQNPESRIQNPESRIQNPKSKIQNPNTTYQKHFAFRARHVLAYDAV